MIMNLCKNYLNNILMSHKYNKYLNKKSVHKLWESNSIPKKKIFDFIISIPCYDEYDYLFETLESINKQDSNLLKNTLVSLVINNSNKENQKIIDNNKKTFQKLLEYQSNYEFLIIDAFSKNNSIDEKDAGVGMARKISIDMTLQYSKSDSIICFIDADTKLSKKYLNTIYSSYIENQWEAATVDFKHLRDEPETVDYINNYEKFLKSTSINLKNSGSPYSYVPLGSTMICTKNAYIAVGGMNKRKAAEDFYFLQELQKTMGIFYIDDILVHPSSRYLNRSYLGTSTRLKQSLKGELNIDTLYYSKQSFNILSKWIASALNSNKTSYANILERCNKIDSKLSKVLISLNLEKAWDGITNAPTKEHFEKQFHRWFDAFKTLKLLKYYS
tara:strand:- start:1624 stop:2784 length:1161 start_codon:yes stop_codon:yes gene_type:complete